jgi:hypothetical protein
MGTALIALLPIGSRALVAQTVAISGNPSAFVVNSAVAGSEPLGLTNSSTTYTVNTPPNPNTKYQVTAQLNANMPVGTTLTATFAPTQGAVSTGAIVLDVTPRQMVNSVRKNYSGTAAITYQFDATVSAGVIPTTTRIVTLTITTFP